MPQLDYKLFRLLPSCAENGGYLVQKKPTGDLVATVVKHPDAPQSSRWEVREYYAPKDVPGGRHALLREAAEAGYDEWA
jgi:hypothetical protein